MTARRWRDVKGGDPPVQREENLTVGKRGSPKRTARTTVANELPGDQVAKTAAR